MPTTVSLYTIDELAKADAKSEILLETHANIELHIVAREDCTIIRFPFGNHIHFDSETRCIVVKPKSDSGWKPVK